MISTKYASKKITKRVILVEKIGYDQESIHQAYIVCDGDKKSLENAISWGETNIYDYTSKSYKHLDAVVHNYDNGEFILTLKNCADVSCSGGKLSFWNCIITTPDNKDFLIGISAEVLLDLLLNNTFINGKCSKKVYLGRIGGQQAALTDNMQLFKDTVNEEKEQKEITRSLTRDYQPGDIVKTKTVEEVYLGEVKLSFIPDWDWLKNCYTSSGEVRLLVYGKPTTRYIYAENYIDESQKDYIYFSVEGKATKPKRAVAGKHDYSVERLKSEGLKNILVKRLDENINSKNTWIRGVYTYFLYKKSLEYNGDQDINTYIQDSINECKKLIKERFPNYYDSVRVVIEEV